MFQNQFNMEEFISFGERMDTPNTVVPDLAFTVEQMINRAQRNIPIETRTDAVYYGDELMPDLQFMDNIDKAHALKLYKEHYDGCQARIHKAQQEQIRLMNEVKKQEEDRIKALEAKGGQIVPDKV